MKHKIENLGDDMEALSLEIEREKFEYLEKSKHLQDQLKTFKSEIDNLKLDEKVSDLDKIHNQQRSEGENKYSTIQKVAKQFDRFFLSFSSR